MSFYNPFQNLELRVPEDLRNEIDIYCQTQPAGGAKPLPQDSPFSRQVDLWFLSICIGSKVGLDHSVKKWHRFMTGEILVRDPYRIELMELLAIAYSNDPWIIKNPSKVLEIANQLAASGLRKIFGVLSIGNEKPIWNLTHYFLNELK